uniref:Uncharacterized protein n=1 Tax=Glossina palpalis gambiensis TaxID=67801 RepID=A0A1B0C2A1_9MUSC
MYARLVQGYGLEYEVAQHLAKLHGDRAFEIAKMASLAGNRVYSDFPCVDAEVRYGVREYACNAVDMIARRLRLSFLNVQAAQVSLPRICDIMAEELDWSRTYGFACLKSPRVIIIIIHFGERQVLKRLCAIVIINDFLYKPLMHKWIYMNQSQIFGSYEDLEPLDDILQAERQPSRRDSIFFHETSGEWKKLAFPSIYQSVDERINYAHLTFRQACAIESAALHNRKSDVFVLFAASRYIDAAIRNESRFKVLLHYKNVHFRNVHLWSYTLNTPGYAWLKKDEVFMSRYFVSHISDFLRFMTLWRFGGTYLDTDTITLKSLELLPPNYAGIESKFNVAAGNYKYNEWNTNGPGVITNIACEICNSTEIRKMPYLRTCKGFHIHDHKLFYAIRYPYWEDFFESKKAKSVLKQLRQSYVAHFWNKLSAGRNFAIGDGCAYDILAQQHCPRLQFDKTFSGASQQLLLIVTQMLPLKYKC